MVLFTLTAKFCGRAEKVVTLIVFSLAPGAVPNMAAPPRGRAGPGPAGALPVENIFLVNYFLTTLFFTFDMKGWGTGGSLPHAAARDTPSGQSARDITGSGPMRGRHEAGSLHWARPLTLVMIST